MRFFCYILEKEDDFDWGKYLMEGEEIDLGPDTDTPVGWSGFVVENVNACPDAVCYFKGSFYLQCSTKTGILFLG